MTRDALRRQPLRRLYELLMADPAPSEAEAIVSVIEERAGHAINLYSMEAVRLSQTELEDLIARLDGAETPSDDLDPITDTVEREVARVQREALLDEFDRRQAVLLAANRDERVVPTRSELVGGVMAATEADVDEAPSGGGPSRLERLSSFVDEALSSSPRGSMAVVRSLRAVRDLPVEVGRRSLDLWILWALALETLTRPRAEGLLRTSVDPVTMAAANRAKRLLYAVDRQDARYDDSDWPLDLTGDDIADFLERHYQASWAWARSRAPASDRGMYLRPVRREETGRPNPHMQVADEREARRAAEEAGGFPEPLIFPVPPRERSRVAQALWTNGLPPVPERKPGLAFYNGGGDPKVRWGGPPHPYGVLCAVALPPKAVLHVFDKERPEDHDTFNELTARATFLSRTDDDYHERVRNVFRSEGYQAVAHYDPNQGYLHELIVVDPSPETVMIVRESIPSFRHGTRPLSLPRTHRRVAPMLP